MSREIAYTNLIKNNDSKIIAEVGVWKGELSIRVLNECAFISEYYMIDPLLQDLNNFEYSQNNSDFPTVMLDNRYICNMNENTKTQSDLDLMYSNILTNIEKYNNAKFIRKTSAEACKDFPDDYFDLVFIDAIHLYDNVMEDIKLWIKKVKPGGIIAGDDYTDKFPGVMQAVNEYFQGSHKVDYGVWYTIK